MLWRAYTCIPTRDIYLVLYCTLSIVYLIISAGRSSMEFLLTRASIVTSILTNFSQWALMDGWHLWMSNYKHGRWLGQGTDSVRPHKDLVGAVEEKERTRMGCWKYRTCESTCIIPYNVKLSWGLIFADVRSLPSCGFNFCGQTHLFPLCTIQSSLFRGLNFHG